MYTNNYEARMKSEESTKMKEGKKQLTTVKWAKRAKEEKKSILLRTFEVYLILNMSHYAKKFFWTQNQLVRRLFGPIDVRSSSRDAIASTFNTHLILRLYHVQLKRTFDFSSILNSISMFHDVSSIVLHCVAVFREPIAPRVSNILSEFCDGFGKTYFSFNHFHRDRLSNFAFRTSLTFADILPADPKTYDKMRPPNKDGPTSVYFHVTVMGQWVILIKKKIKFVIHCGDKFCKRIFQKIVSIFSVFSNKRTRFNRWK